MRRLLPWGSVRLALAVWSVLAGGLVFATPPALASGEPEAPTTGGCVRLTAIPEVCGKLNPSVKAKAGFYFAYDKGAACAGGLQTSLEPEAEVQDKEVSAELTGLEANTQYTYCLVATNQSGKTFGNAVSFTTAPVAPTVQNLSATEITDETATLEVQVNPENSETEYEVVIADPCGGPPDCILSSGKIIPPSGREYVRIELAGKELHLEPNTTYEYWIIAKNTDAQKVEVHETFTTLKAPSIDSESATDITEHDAILEAKINTQGQDVYYQFQIVKNSSELLPELACPTERSAELCLGSPATSGALPIGFLLAAPADGSVGVDLERERGVTLQPETTYHYRVIAVRAPMSEDTITWQGPPAYGADQTFTTQGPQSTGLGFLTGSETGAGTGNVVCQNNVASTGCAVADLTPGHPKRLTRAQKLAKALKQCKSYRKKSKRAKCEKVARKSYGPLSKRARKKHRKP
jgi:hypothetical protein